MMRDNEAPRGEYTAVSYFGVLEDQIPTLWEPGLLVMQDNARVHIVKTMRDWLKEIGIELIEWPPHSPD